MSIDERKPENTNKPTDKQYEYDKIGDLPNQPQTDKDADKVKGGMRPNVPRDL
jgi:hypothetical protein